MDATERERQHHRNLQRIDHVQVVIGRGDRARIDHEGTLLERARLMEEELSAHAATEQGLDALHRLLLTLEEHLSPHTHDVAAFVAAVWNNQPLPLGTLRGLDRALGDDMLAVLDAHRHARLNLIEHVQGGPARVARALGRRLAANG